MEDNKVNPGSYLIFIVSLGLIGLCILLSVPLYMGFVGGIAFSAWMLMRRGYGWKTLRSMMAAGIKDCSMVFIVIILIGATVSSWLSSGIVPTLMYYGFEYIKHINFVLASFIFSLVVSIVMGTALGTISTTGIALIGIGKGFAIPEPLLLGAVVSGAFIADRISPLSGLVNLTIKTVEIKYREYVRGMLLTLVSSVLLASSIYFFIGKGYMSEIDPRRLSVYQENISGAFVVTPYLLLLPLMVIFLSVLGVKPFINMGVGVAGGVFFSIFVQHKSVLEVSRFILSGYKSATGIEELDAILRGGGIQPMIEVLLIVAGAVALSSLLEGTNIINPIIEHAVGMARSKFSLISRTAVFSSLLTIVTCDQTAGIILLGKQLKSRYEDLGMNRRVLAGVIAETGTTIAPLIPWNVNSIIILAITGMSTLNYAPYAVLCYITPLTAIVYGYIANRR